MSDVALFYSSGYTDMDSKSRATFIDLLHQILWKKEFIIVKFQNRVFQVTKRQLANFL